MRIDIGQDSGAEEVEDRDKLEDRVKDKLSSLSMVVDNLIWTAQTEDGGPQASELQTANRSLSALASHTNIDGLTFDEEIQKNATFLKF